MVKVEMPRGNWETVIYILEDWLNQYRPSGNVVGTVLLNEIADQVYSQEY